MTRREIMQIKDDCLLELAHLEPMDMWSFLEAATRLALNGVDEEIHEALLSKLVELSMKQPPLHH